MAIIVLLLLLCISFTAHIFYLIAYVRSHNEHYLRRFLDTTVVNVVTAGLCIVLAIFRPAKIDEIDGSVLVWLMSGALMTAIMLLQASIFARVRRRAKLPEYYHYNYFGKKVLKPSVLGAYELLFFFLSLPFFLIAGAYFIARAIKLFL
ncbi:MAG: hypothetical protein JXA07_16430 [Spirochaetes bacterium]|nr:hypothetical protein [Spirochaetota bacterium]